MGWIPRTLLVGTVAVALTGAVVGQPPDRPRPAEPPKAARWEDTAKAKGLDEKDIQLLRQHKFVITGKPLKQVFQPYLSSDVPVFITPDSLLNGFHVLFEESIYRMEQAHARKLPGILERLWKDLDRAGKGFKGDARLLEAARKRAGVFLGTARHLLDARALPEDAALRKLVEQEAQRVIAAREKLKPAWLGPPDHGFTALDYSRFQPRGFYTKSPALQRYFRAVSWLQAIPFRLDDDEELAAFFLLRRAYRDPDREKAPEGAEFWGAFRTFLGTEDDWDLPSASVLPKEITKEGLDEVRKEYRDRAGSAGAPQINDQLRFAPDRPDGKVEIAFRFLSAYRLPDGILFQRTMNLELKDRDFPTGLEVCAVLGSSFARDWLTRGQPKVMKEIDRSRPLFRENSLYGQYLRCLGVVLERTEPDAPAFLHKEAWKIKTCQTALAGWAQMRYTWALQAKQGAHYLSESTSKAGFVEPVPEFYARLAELVEATRDALQKAGALDAVNTKEMMKELASDLEAAVKIVEKAHKQKKGLASLSPEEKTLLTQFDPQLNDLWDRPEKEQASEKALADLDRLVEFYQLLGKGDTPEAIHILGFDTSGLGDKWERLARICHRLEILAHKQLRQVPFSDKENEFLRSYGKQLARMMLYGGNSYFDPRDDAPRIVDVFTNPVADKHLLVGTARPRLLWVLYPVKGTDILCRGAVLPYHEFAHGERLTDSAWKFLLDSPRRPELPDWIRPVTAPERSSKQPKTK